MNSLPFPPLPFPSSLPSSHLPFLLSSSPPLPIPSCPHPLLSSPHPLPSSTLPPLPLEVGPLIQLEDLGSAAGSPSADKNDFVHIGVKKVQLWWQQFLLIFLRRNVIFCTKTSLIPYGGSNSS